MTSPHDALTANQRDEIRQHVLHEWRMVRCSVQALIDSQFGELRLNRCVYEAVLDSLLLHARSLYDFFKLPVKFPTDVKAQQLLPGEQRSWEPSGLDSLQASIQDINQLCTHLTWNRLDRSATWPVTDILREVNSAFDQFVEMLPLDERQLWRA